MRFSKAVVKYRIPILILTVLLMIPAVIGIANTRINYDMLNYLPEDMDTIIGQNELMEDFGKGAFSFIIVEDMPNKDVAALKAKIEQVDHVDTVIWYDTLFDLSVPMELLPDQIYTEFNTDHSTMMAVFFDSSTSADITMDAIREIRTICGKQCYVSGMSALVTDLKDLCEQEEPIYVGIAVALACAAMLLFLDSWLVPFVFLASIGMMILLNLGSNIFMGEISYITKALSAVLQLAVTMDYSIFLWESYNEQRVNYSDNKEAMAVAIQKTLTSVVGSSITTVAGFVSLCFMSFTMGRDLGIVMAKGVLLGVIGCVTVLPALILILDKPLQKTKHKALIPNMGKLAKGIVKVFPVFLVIFALLVPPAYYGYSKTNDEVYYDMGECLPEDMEYVIANSKLAEDFNIASTHMLLIDTGASAKNVRKMIGEMEQVDGVKYVLGLESVIGSRVPEEILPESIVEILKSDKWELMLVNSEYKVASDEVNEQINITPPIQSILQQLKQIQRHNTCGYDQKNTCAKQQNFDHKRPIHRFPLFAQIGGQDVIIVPVIVPIRFCIQQGIVWRSRFLFAHNGVRCLLFPLFGTKDRWKPFFLLLRTAFFLDENKFLPALRTKRSGRILQGRTTIRTVFHIKSPIREYLAIKAIPHDLMGDNIII